ncbi:MAG TPA: hypothetical protein VEY70_18020 [Metabacillus sp.]|nr:hypothetical protein [Metabacillus sp.]
MRVMVFGAQSHIGFALCEKFLEEGVEVGAIFLESSAKMNKLLLEERMMLIGRNALFQKFSLEDEWRNDECTHVIYCKEAGHNQDQRCFEKSVERAAETKSQYFYVTSAANQIDDDHQHFKTLTFYSIFKLPRLFGPFQPPEEPIHQHLASFLTGQKRTLIIEEPILFIKDAVETLVELIENCEHGKVYSFLSELKKEEIESFSVELKMNATETANDKSIRHSITNQTTIEKGLFDQLSCIKAYREIYGL